MTTAKRHSDDPDSVEVPLQVTVPHLVKRQLDLIAAGAGRTKRSLVLEALRSVGVNTTDEEIEGRRPRRTNTARETRDG